MQRGRTDVAGDHHADGEAVIGLLDCLFCLVVASSLANLHAHLFARVEATTKQNRQSNSPTTASPSA